MTVFVARFVFFFKQKTAYEMRISDWSSDVCSSDLGDAEAALFERDVLCAAGARHADAVEQAADPALADLVRQLPFILDADLRIGRVLGAEPVGQAGHLARLDRKSVV